MPGITKDDLIQTENRIVEKMQLIISPLAKTVGEHEDILRGKDRTSGMIKKINYLWILAGTGAGGLLWKLWDFLGASGNTH